MATTRKTAPKAQTVPAASRGKASDPAKYELFAEWAMKEHGFKLDPVQAQFTVLQYKHFQASDANKAFNAKKAKAAPTPTKPAVKATAAKAPAKPAKKTTTKARIRKAAA